MLGPTIFNIFTHDIPQFPHTSTALYADDTAIYSHSFAATVANKQLQIHAHILEHYYNKWKIQLNATKPENIIITRKFAHTKTYTPIKINNTPTHTTNTVKYLGVHLDNRLNFKQHIKQTLRKAYATTKTLYPLLAKTAKTTQQNKKLIYTSILRPIITYAAPIWCHTSKHNIQTLQKYQNKILRLITNSDRYTKITQLHELTNIEYIHTYINKIATKFYKTQTHHNPLIKNIHKTPEKYPDIDYKHKPPYFNLDLK